MKNKTSRTTILVDNIEVGNTICKKIKNTYSVAEIYVFNEKLLKNHGYEEIIKTNKISRAGIYIIKQKALPGFAPIYYVGETSDICVRTKQHELDKLAILENAENMIYITSCNGDIFRDKNNREIIEYKMATLEGKINHQNISKTKCPKTNDEVGIYRFFEDVYSLLKDTIYAEDLCGIKAKDVWNSKPIVYGTMKKNNEYYLYNNDNELVASMLFVNLNELHVKKGTLIANTISENMNAAHRRPIENKLNELHRAKAIRNNMLTKDVIFDSSYSLGCIITGTSANVTNQVWHDEYGNPVKFPNKTVKRNQMSKKQKAA